MFILLGTTTVSLNIGHPAKIFELDIDSGSDLTWVQCDAPCTGCTEPREHLYRPNNNLLQCKDLLCTAFHSPASHPCETTDDQCDYEVKYADHGSSLGVLVKDYFPLKFTNGSLLSLHLAFGKRCSCGPAELVFDGKATSVKGLDMIFDSGSSYNYFNSQAYQAIVTLVRNDLKGKPLKDATEDQSLPICWKGRKPFKFVRDAKNYFKPLSLSFTNAKNVQRQLSPQTYLIVTKHGNVCLGILNGTEVGLGNLNIIGDITLQDKMLIYDNENQRIGWAPANCNTLPKSRTIAIIAR